MWYQLQRRDRSRPSFLKGIKKLLKVEMLNVNACSSNGGGCLRGLRKRGGAIEGEVDHVVNRVIPKFRH